MDAYCSLDVLPNEMWAAIFSHVDGPTRVVSRMVCWRWHYIIPRGTAVGCDNAEHRFLAECVYLNYKNLLRWALKKSNKYPGKPSDAYAGAARAGSLERVKWLKESCGLTPDGALSETAARYQHWDILEWTLDYPIEWTPYVHRQIAAGGRLDLLKGKRGPRFLENYLSIMTGALEFGRWEIYSWALRQLGSRSPLQLHTAMELKSVKKDFHDAILSNGSVDGYRWYAQTLGGVHVKESKELAVKAAGRGHAELVRHLLMELYGLFGQAPEAWANDLIREASLGGHDNVLQVILSGNNLHWRAWQNSHPAFRRNTNRGAAATQQTE